MVFPTPDRHGRKRGSISEKAQTPLHPLDFFSNPCEFTFDFENIG